MGGQTRSAGFAHQRQYQLHDLPHPFPRKAKLVANLPQGPKLIAFGRAQAQQQDVSLPGRQLSNDLLQFPQHVGEIRRQKKVAWSRKLARSNPLQQIYQFRDGSRPTIAKLAQLLQIQALQVAQTRDPFSSENTFQSGG